MIGSMMPDQDSGRVPQSLRTVTKAEFYRSVRRGGLRRGLAVTAVAGTLAGLLTLAISTYLTEGQVGGASAITVTLPVEASTSTAAIAFSASAVIYFGRSVQNGTIPISLVLVPNRTRLLVALMVATATLGLATTLLVAIPIAISAVAFSSHTVELLPVVAGVLSGAIATALVALLALFIAILVRRAVSGILVYVGLWMVLPLLLTAVGPILPAWLNAVSTTLIQWTPTALLGQATTIPLSNASSAGLLQGFVGLGLWSIVLGAAANAAFRRRSI